MPEHWCICGEHTLDASSTVGLQIRTGTSTSHTGVFNNSEPSQGHYFDVCCEGYRPRGDAEGQIRQAKGSNKIEKKKKINTVSNWLIKRPSLRLGYGVWYGRRSQWGSIITGPMESHSGSAGAGGQGLAATRPCRKWWRVSQRTRLPTRIYDAWVKARQPWIVKSPPFFLFITLVQVYDQDKVCHLTVPIAKINIQFSVFGKSFTLESQQKVYVYKARIKYGSAACFIQSA